MSEEEKVTTETTKSEKKSKLKNYIDQKNLTKKKVIKVTTIAMVVALIVFSTISNAIIDPEHLNFFKWLTNSLILVAIMVFGLFMGESIGEDEQKERKFGLYQESIKNYESAYKLIEDIRIYFSNFFLWYKDREIRQAKIDYLMNNEIDGRWAKICVDKLEKADFVVGKFIIDESKPKEKVYMKEMPNGETAKIHKATQEEANKIIKMFDVKIETYGYAYYLSYTENDVRGGNLRKAVPLNKKLHNNKLFNRILKIVSTLFISLVWGMLTVKEFSSGAERMQAWFLLISRITCLVSSIISGWTSAVISVKIQSNIINNKKDVLNDFRDSVDNHLFVPETYDEMVEREYQEQYGMLDNQENNVPPTEEEHVEDKDTTKKGAITEAQYNEIVNYKGEAEVTLTEKQFKKLQELEEESEEEK